MAYRLMSTLTKPVTLLHLANSVGLNMACVKRQIVVEVESIRYAPLSFAEHDQCSGCDACFNQHDPDRGTLCWHDPEGSMAGKKILSFHQIGLRCFRQLTLANFCPMTQMQRR